MEIDQQGLYQTVSDMYTMVNDELGERYQPFINYGYGLYPAIELAGRDAPSAIYAQLYHYVLGKVDVAGREVLEIGSGRGGGCHYIKQYLNAAAATGIEYMAQSVEISQASFNGIEGLTFFPGDAGHLDLPGESADIVVNIESSHCYPDLQGFFNEVIRVLRPGGYFCYADLMTPEMSQQVQDIVLQLPVERRAREDISSGVVEGLSLINERKLQLINDMTLSPERKQWWINEWACTGTPIWEQLRSGELVYMHYVLQKAL